MDRWPFVSPDTCQLLLCSSSLLFFFSSHLISFLFSLLILLSFPALFMLPLLSFCPLLVEDQTVELGGRRCTDCPVCIVNTTL